MSGVPVWQDAVALPWLRPSDAALLALTTDPPDAQAILGDPAAVAHVLRFVRPTPRPDESLFTSAVLSQPGLVSGAADLLEHCAARPVTWTEEALSPVNRIADAAAAIASELAQTSVGCSPDVAAAVARLASLGWYSLFAIAPDWVGAQLADSGKCGHAHQKRRWALDAATIARRLAGRWRLPKWAAATTGYLRFQAADAVRLGAPPDLFRVTRAAVAAAERRFGSVGLTDSTQHCDLDAAADRLASKHEPRVAASTDPVPVWLLVRLLRSTAATRRAAGAIWLAEAEQRIDALGETLTNLRGEFETAVRDAKLAGLAEFAAGASHEINNPLAVISGHAQLLLSHETDPSRRTQFGAIIRQTKRVHELLQGTLQFARPKRPAPGRLAVNELVSRVAISLEPEAAAKNGVIEVQADVRDPVIFADETQAREALAELLRNAIAAIPEGGRVRVRSDLRDEAVELTVEDNGPGPSSTVVDHLFDPFFSGRSAGRGRGLGLSFAWRYARLNGGDVRFEPTTAGPTRFVLSFPRAAAQTVSGTPCMRKCA